ncbi:NAD(P)-binding domain-containing protein [Streptomyces sp. CB02115]|uniref:NAD(P)-binding domain-containing protein n=1 Tax=Streptomyces sp. CB02115 TaxID=1703939 RepID=UPI0009388953|nr:NAD(P)-binding domain-containing protein [Streptomyces sp. CB02115]OKJ52898.1 hypothetical protein AMK28_22265 [Streptomyces sp. CB02115]
MGFIGAGPMGVPAVERLIAAGHDVAVSSRALAAATDGAGALALAREAGVDVRTAIEADFGSVPRLSGW